MLDTGGVEPADVRLPRLVNLLRFGETIPIGKGESALVAVEVKASSRLTELTLADSLGHIEGLTAVAVIRGDELLAPRGGTCFQGGDKLLAVTTPAARVELNELIRASTTGIEP
jgi:Trk K+ transport system NAD-binding subunit